MNPLVTARRMFAKALENATETYIPRNRWESIRCSESGWVNCISESREAFERNKGILCISYTILTNHIANYSSWAWMTRWAAQCYLFISAWNLGMFMIVRVRNSARYTNGLILLKAAGTQALASRIPFVWLKKEGCTLLVKWPNSSILSYFIVIFHNAWISDNISKQKFAFLKNKFRLRILPCPLFCFSNSKRDGELLEQGMRIRTAHW